MRRILSWKRFLIVVGVVLAVSAATYGVHSVQIRRQATTLKERAIKAEEAAASDPAKSDEAVSYYEQYLKYRKADEDAFQRYAKLMFARAEADPKRTSQTVDAVENFLRQFPEHAEDRKKLIDLSIKLGRLTTARQHIKMLFKSPRGEFKTDVDLLDKAATCELGLGGDFGQAIQLLDEAAQTKRAPAALFDRLLLMLLGNKSYSDPRYSANKYLELLLNEDPYRSSLEHRTVAARFMLLRGETANAREHLNKALAMPGGATSADVLITAAELEYVEMKTPESVQPQLKKALSHLETAFAAHRRDVRVGLFLSKVLNDQGERKRAIEVLKTTAEALGEKNEEYPSVVDRLLDLGELDLSRQLADRIKTDQPEYTLIVKYLRARMALIESKWTDAKPALEEVAPLLVRVPEYHKKVMAGLGRIYEVLQNPDKQLEYYTAAIKDDPNYLIAKVGEAETLLRLGKYREALPLYKTLVTGYKLEAFRAKLARLELLAVLKQLPNNRKWEVFEESLGPVDLRTAELHILHAESLAARDEMKQAAAILDELVRKDPKNVIAWITLARIQGAGKSDPILLRLDEAEKLTGDTVDVRLARAAVISGRAKRPTPTEIEAFGAGAEKFEKLDQNRLWRGLGEAASRASYLVADADAPAMRALAIKCYEKAADLERTDLISRAVLIDLGLASDRKDVMETALTGIAAIEGPNGPIGTLGRVVRRLPEIRKIENADSRRAALRELREQVNRVKADRPGWSRVYVALARLDELDGLTDEALKNYKEAIEKGERDEMVIRRAVELLRDRRLDDQAALLLNSLYTEVALPEDLERFRAVKDLLARDIPVNERSTIDRVAPADSKEWRILLLRGSLLAAIGENVDAETALAKSVEIGFDVPETWSALVSHLVRQNRIDDARRAIQQAEAKLKTNPPKTDIAKAELVITLASCHELIGDPIAAAFRYQEALRIAPGELNPNKQWILFLQRSGNADEADRLLQKLNESPAQDLARWSRRHRALVLMTRFDAYAQLGAALQLIDRNLAETAKKDPEDVKARAVVQTIDPATRDEGMKTLKDFAKWGDLTPDEYYLLGRLYFDQGKVFESVEFFEKAAKKAWSPEHLAGLIRIYLGINKTDSARSTLERLKVFAPRSWEALREEARLLNRDATEADKRGAADDAKNIRERIREAILKFPATPNRLGALLEELGFAADAETLYIRILNEGKDDGAYLPLAAFLINQKRSTEAIDLAKKYESKAKSPVVTGRIMTGAIRSKSPGATAEREVAAWIDAKLLQPLPTWEALGLLGAKAELLDALGKYDDAIAAYEEAIRRVKAAPAEDAKKVSIDLFVNNLSMVLVLSHPERADRAIEMMTELINRAGPQPTFLDTRAVAYLVKGGKTMEAINDLNLALIQRRRAEYLFHLAWAYDLTPDKRAFRDLNLDEAKKLGLVIADLHALESRKFAELYGK